MEEADLKVLAAENGKIALGILRNRMKPFSLALMDIQMPIMDSLEIVRRIREDPDLQTLPVIARVLDACRAKRREAGMRGCAVKPVESANLLEALASRLAHERRKRRRAR